MSKLIQQLEAIGQNAALRNQPLDQSLLNQISTSNEEKTTGALFVSEHECIAVLLAGGIN